MSWVFEHEEKIEELEVELDITTGERDEARRLAEELRDVLVGLRPAASLMHPFRLPWEVEK